MRDTDRGAPRWHWLDVALLAGVGVLAVVTRLRQLGAESIWLDEATTFERARLPIAELVANTVEKMHVPTYFVFMHYFLRLGDDEWMLRLPSAIFGILKVPLVAAAGTVLGGPRAGAAAGLMLVLSQAHLRYDQEARMYAMQTFGTCVALLAHVWLLVHPEAAARAVSRLSAGVGSVEPGIAHRARCAWSAWILGCTAALYMHNTSALFLVASSLATLVLLASRRDVRAGFVLHWTAANLAVLALWVPWLPRLFSQVRSDRFATRVWEPIGGVERFWTEVAQQMLLAWKLPHIHAIVLGLALIGAWSLRRRPVLIAALLVLSLSAPGLVALVSLAKPMFRPRIMLWGGPAFFLLAAQGITALRKPWLQLGVLTLLAALSLSGLERQYYDRVIKTGWREIAQVLSVHAGDTTLALCHSFKEERPVSYYADRRTHPLRLPRLLRADEREVKREPPARLLRGVRDVFYVHGVRADRDPAAIVFARSRGELVSRTRYRGGMLEHYRLPP